MGAGHAREQKGAGIGAFLVPEHKVARMAASYNRSLILAAQIKSFSLRPSMAWVVKFTSQKL